MKKVLSKINNEKMVQFWIFFLLVQVSWRKLSVYCFNDDVPIAAKLHLFVSSQKASRQSAVTASK